MHVEIVTATLIRHRRFRDVGQGRVYVFKPTLMWRWKEKEIRVNLDTRPMKDVVKTFHFPIPTPQAVQPVGSLFKDLGL